MVTIMASIQVWVSPDGVEARSARVLSAMIDRL